MNFSRSMILWGTVLTLSGFCGVMPPVLADEDERTTAKDVVDSKTDMEYQDNLKKFVLSARDYFLSLPLSELLGLADILREEGGDWNYKSMYLVVLIADGTVYRHGEDPSKDGTDISVAVDDNGKEVGKEILAAADAEEEGGFVEYTWDDPSTDKDVNPRVCYAIKGGHPAFPGQEFILVGGYHHNVTSTEDETEGLPEFPEVSAQDVRDRETLKAFVQGAGDWALRALPTLSFDLPKLETEFRLEGGHWRHGSTYIFAMAPDGNVIFHGSRPDQEGRIRIDLEDRNGFQFVRALFDAADDEEASGYVEYYWDDPGVTGDEEFGSAKVGYAEAVTLPNDYAIFPGATIVIGSGFYKGGQVALDFAHFANGGGITSDIVLLNAAAKPVRPAIYFYDMDGERIAPEFVMDLTDNLEVKSYGALTVNEEIPSLGELTISTHGRGTKVVVGSVKVVSDAPDSPIGGVLRFDLTGTGVAGVGASQPVRDAIFPARRVAGGINTGAAFRNLSESRMELTCRLMMGGEVLEEQPVDLPANGQRPQFINQIFEETDTSDFTGSVRCMAPPGDQQFTAVALELEDRKVFTTLPVIPLEGEMPSGDEMMSEE